jgi:hypothetical protein
MLTEAIIAVAEGKCKLNDVAQEFPLTNISTVRNHVDAYHEGLTIAPSGRYFSIIIIRIIFDC